jgi:hypothetical protein
VETFIVRIYRRIAGRAGEPAGTVERVGTAERIGFSDSRELLERLLAWHNAPVDGAAPRAGAEDTP